MTCDQSTTTKMFVKYVIAYCMNNHDSSLLYGRSSLMRKSFKRITSPISPILLLLLN